MDAGERGSVQMGWGGKMIDVRRQPAVELILETFLRRPPPSELNPSRYGTPVTHPPLYTTFHLLPILPARVDPAVLNDQADSTAIHPRRRELTARLLPVTRPAT